MAKRFEIVALTPDGPAWTGYRYQNRIEVEAYNEHNARARASRKVQPRAVVRPRIGTAPQLPKQHPCFDPKVTSCKPMAPIKGD